MKVYWIKTNRGIGGVRGRDRDRCRNRCRGRDRCRDRCRDRSLNLIGYDELGVEVGALTQ